jgi:hypothetical protein
MVITSTLPADFDASSIAIRSSLQDINIYIDGTLREQYSTSKTRLIGKIPPAVSFSAPPPMKMPERSSALN